MFTVKELRELSFMSHDGDIFELKKLADELNRDFYADVVELKATFCQ